MKNNNLVNKAKQQKHFSRIEYLEPKNDVQKQPKEFLRMKFASNKIYNISIDRHI